jgi:anion-transporting  ArsA/GET3 family ATPase
MLMQKEYIKRIEGIGGDFEVVEIPSFPYEIKGVEKLKEVEKILF